MPAINHLVPFFVLTLAGYITLIIITFKNGMHEKNFIYGIFKYLFIIHFLIAIILFVDIVYFYQNAMAESS